MSSILGRRMASANGLALELTATPSCDFVTFEVFAMQGAGNSCRYKCLLL
jgi:hypothetical protein